MLVERYGKILRLDSCLWCITMPQGPLQSKHLAVSATSEVDAVCWSTYDAASVLSGRLVMTDDICQYGLHQFCVCLADGGMGCVHGLHVSHRRHCAMDAYGRGAPHILSPPLPSLISRGDGQASLALGSVCGVRLQLLPCRTTRGTARSRETTTTTQQQTLAVCDIASQLDWRAHVSLLWCKMCTCLDMSIDWVKISIV